MEDLFTQISQTFAQVTTKADSINRLKEIIINYQADKLNPITFQNIISKNIKLKSIGQEPSFLFSETPSITNYSDAGNSQGYSYFILRGIIKRKLILHLTEFH